MTVDLNKVLAQCRDAGIDFYLNSTELKEKVLFIRNLNVKAIMKIDIYELFFHSKVLQWSGVSSHLMQISLLQISLQGFFKTIYII